MIIEKCIICERTMPKTNMPRKSRSKAEITRYFRQTDAITCSKRCSKIYQRIYHRIVFYYIKGSHGKYPRYEEIHEVKK